MSVLAILAFALVFWWARIEHTKAETPQIAGSNADMYAYHLPVREYGFDHLKAGDMPLWNPYTNCGMPFFATYQAGLFYPLNFPHWFIRGALAISIIYMMHIFLAGLFMYMWMRELGCAKTACVFSGTAYMLCSFVCYPLTWPHIILCHTWVPLVFLLVRRTFAMTRWTDAALLGIALTCQFLAGYMQGFMYTLYGAVAYSAFLTVVKLRRRESREVARSVAYTFAGLVIIPALLCACQWIPTLQLSSLSARPPGGLSPEAVLIGGSFSPSMFFAALTNPESFKWGQYTLYSGMLTLVMAAFAFVRLDRWRELAFFSALAVIAALVAFGEHTPIFKLYMYLPTGDWFRVPHRLLILTAFSLATLAGMGCSHLVEDTLSKPFSSRAFSFGIFIALCGAFILLLPKNGALYVFILLIGCLLSVRARSAAMVGALAVFLVGLDLTLHISDGVTYPWITPDVFPELKEEKEFLRENVGLDRVHIFRRKHRWTNFLLNPNFGMEERIRETSGYESLSLQRFAEFCAFLETDAKPSYTIPFVGWRRWSADNLYPRMIDLLGARYIIEDVGRDLYPEDLPPKKMPKGFNYKKVFSGRLNIYENPGAVSRAFYTSNVEVIKEKRAVLKRLGDPSLDYRKTIILEEEPEPPAGRTGAPVSNRASADVVVKPRGEGRIDIVADVPAPGFIFLNDILVPGWRAKVDGVDAKIYRADYLFMAIPVGAGKHMIEVRYRPSGVRMGMWITLLSVALLLLSLAFDMARRRTAEMAPWEDAAGPPDVGTT